MKSFGWSGWRGRGGRSGYFLEESDERFIEVQLI